MLQIDVYIGEGLDPAHPENRIFVPQSPAALHTGDDVIWHIHSLDREVEEVEIEFKETKFFEARKDGRTVKRRTKLHDGHGNILGNAPERGERGSFPNKYNVTAFGASGQSLGSAYKLDPTIITCEP